MQKFNSFEWLLILLGTMVFDSDKESLTTRLHQGELFLGYLQQEDIESVLTFAKAFGDADNYEGVRVACHDIIKVLKGEPIDSSIGLDDCSSGIQHISLGTRCEKGLNSIGAIHTNTIDTGLPGNFYQVITDRLNACHIGTKYWDRKLVKTITIPYFYGSQACLEVLGPKLASQFEKIYAELVPGGAQFRQAMLNAWDPNRNYYYWRLPDGFTALILVVKSGKQTTIDLYLDGKKSFSMRVQENTSLDYGEDGTRALGANIIHALDAWQLREINRAMNMTKKEGLELLKKFKVEIVPENNSRVIQELINITNKTKIVSNRFLTLARKEEESIQVTQSIYDALVAWVNYLPEEASYLLNIHDEFKSQLPYTNDMRRTLNYIKALEYKGEYFAYINRVFHSYIRVNPFKQDVYDAILNSDYMFC